MSKGSLFWGNGSGKLGETVFYRAGGEQRNRTYVKNIKNPKTIAQMTQRLLTLNNLALFKNISALARQTFPSRKSNQSAFNAMVSANAESKKFFLTKEMLAQNLCVPYGAVIARGSMGLDLQPMNVLKTNGGHQDFYAIFNCLFDTSKISSWDLLPEVEATAELEGVTLATILREACVVDLPNEFQVTLVQAVPQDFELANGDIVSPWKLAYKVISVSGSAVTSKIYGCGGSTLNQNLMIVGSSVGLGSARRADFIGFKLAEDDLNEAITRPMGIILSYTQDGQIHVSNSTINGNYKNIGVQTARGVVSEFLKGGAVYQEAMSQYGYSQASVLSSEQLALPTTCNIVFETEGIDGAKITVNGIEAQDGKFEIGEMLTLSVTGTDASNLLGWKVNGVEVGSSNPFEWTVPQASEVVITAVFEEEAA